MHRLGDLGGDSRELTLLAQFPKLAWERARTPVETRTSGIENVMMSNDDIDDSQNIGPTVRPPNVG